MWNAELCTNSSRIIYRAGGATVATSRVAGLIRPYVQCKPDYIHALLSEDRCCYRTIDTTAHCNCNASFIAHNIPCQNFCIGHLHDLLDLNGLTLLMRDTCIRPAEGTNITLMLVMIAPQSKSSVATAQRSSHILFSIGPDDTSVGSLDPWSFWELLAAMSINVVSPSTCGA